MHPVINPATVGMYYERDGTVVADPDGLPFPHPSRVTASGDRHVTGLEHPLPSHRALVLSDFEKLKEGEVVRLYYHMTNEGSFLWKHSHVAVDRVFGQFEWPADFADHIRTNRPDLLETSEASAGLWSTVGPYLYEFMGDVCRGSGAEPVWAVRPPAPPAEDEHDD